MPADLNFLDLFAGAGGLSEGFIQAGFRPIAHVESDMAACYTLRTRMAYHWLRSNGREELYNEYLLGHISRSELYNHVPEYCLNSVINKEIGDHSISKIFQSLNELLADAQLDLIVGGPPCQAYSLIGRSRDQHRMKHDPRNYLYMHYANFLKKYRPKYFVFENVLGLLSAKDECGGRYLDMMIDLFRECGYETEPQVIDASDHGVLQNRKRVILIGRQGSESGFYPQISKWTPNALVGEVFADLPKIRSGQGTVHGGQTDKYSGSYLYESGIRDDSYPLTWHQARPHSDQDLEIYRIAVEEWNINRTRLKYDNLPEELKTHRNRDSFIDRFKVVAADLPIAQTVVAHIAKDGHYYIHPDLTQNRSITPREAARLQTFPDNYYFESITGRPSRTFAFKQIGNAVPVLLAKKIAEELMHNWN